MPSSSSAPSLRCSAEVSTARLDLSADDDVGDINGGSDTGVRGRADKRLAGTGGGNIKPLPEEGVDRAGLPIGRDEVVEPKLLGGVGSE